MKGINPINYKILLEPDLDNFIFSGKVKIELESPDYVQEIALDALELDIKTCRAGTDTNLMKCQFVTEPENEKARISLTRKIKGKIVLEISYDGHINNKMAGFYRSKYESSGKEKYIAVTQFEESDARRAFPCLDHPVKKATFDLEFVINDELTAISNGPIVNEKLLPNGKKSVVFERTPKMSTYLLFFGVGEFEFIEDPGEVLVRAITVPGMTKYADFGLKFGRDSLQFCEEYYDVPYPFSKLDLLAIPDFAFGAMENWGAITFRENLLLHHPESTSKGGEERICNVIAHEMAHQWFGNLVSPSDWRYLWLNESFATYFAYLTVDHYHPEWDAWAHFLNEQTDIAIDRDSLGETFPIEIPGGEHVVINPSTAPIIYNKGGSVLRQVEGYIGEDNLKNGLRYYLKKHQYDCASSSDLWEALEIVSDKPITALMKNWIEQPGFPFIDVEREGGKLTFTQNRFTYLEKESDQQWIIPITTRVFYKDGSSKSITILLENKVGTIDIGRDAITYKVNENQTGFYRTKYNDKEAFNELGTHIVAKELSPEDRWGIQNDLYAFAKCGFVSVDDYLDYLDFYREEDAYLPLSSIAGNLYQAYLILGGSKKIESFGKNLFEGILTNIGYEPKDDEKHTTSMLRDQLLFHAVLFGSETAKEFGQSRFSILQRGNMVHPDIAKSVMLVGAFCKNDEAFDWFVEKLKTSDSEHERMNVLMAMGKFREKEIVEKSLKFVLEEVPDRNKFIPIGSMAANPYAIPFMWKWYVSNLEKLEQFHPIHYERVIGGIVPICGLGKEGEVNTFLGNYMEDKNKARDVIKLSLEKLEIYSRMRNLGNKNPEI